MGSTDNVEDVLQNMLCLLRSIKEKIHVSVGWQI